jgi:SAM-dependent methyltransferase
MPRSAYDRIGGKYAATRRADPRIAALIQSALGSAASVVNVGAGTGSYEPRDRRVVAVEPSALMLRQRLPGLALAVQAFAEALPFRDGSFLTLHHWSNPRRGLAEFRRVAHRVVILTLDPDALETFWLLTEYLPAIDSPKETRAS